MRCRFLFALAAGTLWSGVAQAQPISWNNAAGGAWTASTNWSPANVPDTISESAIISLAGTYSVTLNANENILGLTVGNSAATLDIQNGANLTLNDASLVNAGLIRINPAGVFQSTSFTCNTNSTLSGGGEIRLSAAPAASILATGASATLTQSAGNQVTGFGAVTAALVNNGLVSANVNGQTLQLSSNAKTNNNIMNGTSGGTLSLNGISVTQGAGGRLIADGGTVLLVSAGITGGTTESTNGGLVDNTGTSTLSDVSNLGDLAMEPGSNIFVGGSGLTNNGLVRLNRTGVFVGTTLRFDASNLSGSGEIRMRGSGAAAVLTTGTGVTMTQASTHKITGSGQISASLISNGTVSADQSGVPLTLFGSGMTNNATMQGTAGAVLSLSGLAVTQSDGARLLGDNGTVSLNGATVNFGRFETTNGGLIDQASGTSTLKGVTNNGEFAIEPGTSISVIGSGFANNGTTHLNRTGIFNATLLRFDATGSLSGTGELQMRGSGPACVVDTGTGFTITHVSPHRITGSGQINAALTNNSLISADQPGLPLTLLGNTKTNNSVMQATSGATLALSSVSVTQGAGAKFLADNGTVSLNTSAITAGSFESTNGGFIDHVGGTTTLTDVTNNALFKIEPGTAVNVAGAGLVDNGLMRLNPTGVFVGTALRYTADGTLSGTGELQMRGNGAAAVLATSAGVTITHSSPHKITGSGDVDAAMINNSLISADQGNALILEGSAKTNNSVMQAAAGGTLIVSNTTITQGSGGVISANGGNVSLQSSAAVSGGQITSQPGNFVEQTTTCTLTDVTLNADFEQNPGTLTIVLGSGLTNNGLFHLNRNAVFSGTTLRFDVSGNLDGTGELRINGNGPAAVLNTAGPAVLTQTASHTTTGWGQIFANFVNNGTVNANVSGGTLDINVGSKTNNGLMKASSGGTLQLSVNVNGSGQWVADGATIRIQPGIQVTTSGPIRSLNGGSVLMQASNPLLTGSTLFVDQASSLSPNGNIQLSGSYSFATTNAAHIPWPGGATLTMTGGSAGGGCSSVAWSTIEAGSTDNNSSGSGSNNFGLGNLVVAAGASAALVDYIDNGHRNGSGGAHEAVYATSLTLGAGSKLNLNGLHLYAGGVRITPGAVGGGTVVDTTVLRAGDMNCDGRVDGADIEGFTFAELNPAGYAAQYPGCNICAADLDGDGAAATPSDATAFVNMLLQAPIP